MGLKQFPRQHADYMIETHQRSRGKRDIGITDDEITCASYKLALVVLVPRPGGALPSQQEIVAPTAARYVMPAAHHRVIVGAGAGNPERIANEADGPRAEGCVARCTTLATDRQKLFADSVMPIGEAVTLRD